MAACSHNITKSIDVVKLGGIVTEKTCTACKEVVSTSFRAWQMTPSPLDVLAERVAKLEKLASALVDLHRHEAGEECMVCELMSELTSGRDFRKGE